MQMLLKVAVQGEFRCLIIGKKLELHGRKRQEEEDRCCRIHKRPEALYRHVLAKSWPPWYTSSSLIEFCPGATERETETTAGAGDM